MLGDRSTSAFNGLQAVVLGILSAAVGGTLVLYALGLPLELSGVVFLALLAATFVLSIPLWKRVDPRFEHADRE